MFTTSSSIFLYGLMPFCVHFTSYWFFVGLFYSIDKKFIYNSDNNQKKYFNAIKKSLSNQILYGIPIILLSAPYIEFAIKKSINDTFMSSILKIIVISNLSNILFYIIHRLLHTKYLYKLIHKVHHEYIITVSPCALYAHPIEYIIANNLVFLIPYCLIGTKLNIGLFMIIFSSFMTTSAHINQKLLFIDNSHLYHHKKINYNFGFGRFIDKFFLTNYN